MRKPEELKKRNDRVSLYDLETPAIRKGISGWKLTKRPIGLESELGFVIPPQNGVYPGGEQQMPI